VNWQGRGKRRGPGDDGFDEDVSTDERNNAGNVL
jgi:hypothetical protein